MEKENFRFGSCGRGRFRFVSMNLDDLPDGGESILREHGLDWPALRMEGGQKNPVYQAYCRFHPRVLRISPTGYAAIYLTSSRDSRGYERNLQSWLARQWTRADYNSQLQSIYAGEFLVLDPSAPFDPAVPPEIKGSSSKGLAENEKVEADRCIRSEKELKEIQACFMAPPARYLLPFDQAISRYEKADSLCRKAISSHPSAPDLWMVRNRRIAALLALWKLKGEYHYFSAATEEAKLMIDAEHPKGADVIARFCLARKSIRDETMDPKDLIQAFAPSGREKASAPEIAAASLLSLDVGERKLHEEYRRAYLDAYAEHPAMWTMTAFFYWTATTVIGCITLRLSQVGPGRRQGYFLAVGEPEDANRSLRFELENLDGERVRFRNRRGQVDDRFLCLKRPAKSLFGSLRKVRRRKTRSTT